MTPAARLAVALHRARAVRRPRWPVYGPHLPLALIFREVYGKLLVEDLERDSEFVRLLRREADAFIDTPTFTDLFADARRVRDDGHGRYIEIARAIEPTRD